MQDQEASPELKEGRAEHNPSTVTQEIDKTRKTEQSQITGNSVPVVAETDIEIRS